MNLTKTVIDKAVYRGKDGSRDVRWDAAIKGLGLRIYPDGQKAFVLSYRINGRKRLMTIGRFGVLTVDEARKLAKTYQVDILKGIDPLGEKHKVRDEMTFKELAGKYLDHAKVHNAPSWKNFEWNINKHLLPAWETRKLTAIKKGDMSALHSRIGSTHPYAANRVLALIGRMFSLAALWGYVPEDHPNPARGIQKFKEQGRDRWVTPEELPTLAEAINKNQNPFVRAAFWLFMLTGCRRSELLGAKWEDVDFDRCELRIPKTKSGRVHYVPLSDQAMRILKALPRFKENPHIFPGRKHEQPLQGIKRHWQKVKEAAGLLDVHLHDLRRTCGSWLATSGESLNLIGKILGHSTPRVTQVYARLAENKVKTALEEHGRRLIAAAEKRPDPTERMVMALWKGGTNGE
jgi:integrase